MHKLEELISPPVSEKDNTTYDKCLMYDTEFHNFSTQSTCPSFTDIYGNRSAMETVSCQSWTYDKTYMESTITAEVSHHFPKIYFEWNVVNILLSSIVFYNDTNKIKYVNIYL